LGFLGDLLINLIIRHKKAINRRIHIIAANIIKKIIAVPLSASNEDTSKLVYDDKVESTISPRLYL